MNNMSSHTAQDGHALLRERVEAPLKARIAELEAECETERLRLAACGVAALGYFNGCKDEYRSASLEDTLRLYEQNTELRARIAELEKENESIKKTVRLHNLTDDRYYELLSRARRVYRYHGVNSVLLDAAIREMDALIQRHDREISDEDEAAYADIDAAMKEQA